MPSPRAFLALVVSGRAVDAAPYVTRAVRLVCGDAVSRVTVTREGGIHLCVFSRTVSTRYTYTHFLPTCADVSFAHLHSLAFSLTSPHAHTLSWAFTNTAITASDLHRRRISV